MCLYPKLILNKKFFPTRKNNYNPPPMVDGRTMYVPVGCGKCIECKKQKARNWQVRLNEEAKVWKYKYCLTLTFSNEELEQALKYAHSYGVKKQNKENVTQFLL